MTDIQKIIKPILLKYGVEKASLFGSYVNGDFDEDSDIDILIQPPKGMGMEYISMKHELEDSLKKKVDLVCYKSIDKYLKPYILDSQQPIL